jgi:serine protease
MDTTDATPIDPRTPSSRRFVWPLVALGVAAAIIAGLLLTRPAAPPTAAEHAAPSSEAPAEPYDPAEISGQLSFVVDQTLVPTVAEVAGVHEGDAPRPTARFVDSSGQPADLVLNELMIATSDRAALDAFVARWSASIVDEMPPTDEGIVDYLVRLDPSAVDPTRGPDALLELEPHQPGEMRFGDEAALRLIALAAIDARDHGLAIMPNWLEQASTIEDGTSIEAEDAGERNAFNWSYLRDGGTLDIGVAPAWQLLNSHGKLDDERVRIMIVDGGFYPNPDFPDVAKIRKGEWHEKNAMTCTGGNLCPWHGSDVTLAAMGKLDNEYGAAGPAGPVAELVALVADTDSFTRLKKVREVAGEEKPDIVNMSYGTGVTAFRGIAADTYDRNFDKVRKGGATLFASAGNDGIDVDSRACIGKHCYETLLVVPCESTHVICVGGTKTSSTWKADGSNFGGRPGTTSVELWAPYCMRVMNDAGDPFYETETKTSCGTSFSSPFVAGIAGLLKAADPSLSHSQIRDVLAGTAHRGGVHFDHLIAPDWQRRVDALAAVERVLGASPARPTVTIDSPDDGRFFSLDHWFDLRSTATSFAGGPLPVAWTSSIDGNLGVTDLSGDLTIPPLSPGTHVLSAWVADTVGQSAIDQVTIEVGNTPPTVDIVTPADGDSLYEGQSLLLAGFTQDLDHYGPLPDEAVRWEVRKVAGGALVFEGTGHIAEVPGTAVQPGELAVRFVADDDGIVVEDQVKVDVLAVPLGEHAPTAYILEPTVGTELGTGGGKVEVRLHGSAYDPGNGWLSGTRFRWTARSQAGTKVDLCTGSSFPGGGEAGGIGGVVVLNDCSDVVVQLGLDPAVGDAGGDGLIDPTVWTITLEVQDSAGLPDTEVTTVTISLHVA